MHLHRPLIRCSRSFVFAQHFVLSRTARLVITVDCSRAPPRRRAMATLQRSAFFEAMQKHDPDSLAVVHADSGRSFSYSSLLHDVSRTKEKLLRETGKDDESIAGERVAFLVENGYDYVGARNLHCILEWL